MALLQELKRRNMFRMAVAYLVTAWLLIEVAATLEETLHLPAADRYLEELKGAADRFAVALDVAGVYAYRGMPEETFEWINRALHMNSDIDRAWLDGWEFDELRDDPRWVEVMARLGD